ncbi:MAG: hypothetical protein AAFU71_13030, partial [Cyanobacteria bacterium J06632_22]
HELATGFALIAASTDQQSAYELGGLGHGLLSYYLLQGLAGQAEKETSQLVTVKSLQEYVLNELKKKSVAVGFQQAPMGRADGNLGDMILVDWRGGARPKLADSPADTADAGSVRDRQTGAQTQKPTSLATQLKIERLQAQKQYKLEQYKREEAQLAGAVGEAEVVIEQRLDRLLQEIERLEQEIEEALHG